ncbi:phosphotriesterase [Chloroflexota bacterium]
MAMINSVLGLLETSQMGTTLMHEHILGSSIGIPQNYPEILDRGYMRKIIEKLKVAKGGGIDTVVDATTLDLGRDVNILAEASRRSGVNIICCTGWWTEKTRFLSGVSVDKLAKGFVREIREGIAGTGIKAGILKGASDKAGVLTEEETILRAVARAHHETDVPIMLHSYSPGQVGRRQIQILKEEGVNLKRVKMDHSNDTTDLEYLTWILKEGCYLGMDRYPGEGASPLARTRTLKKLIDVGYKDRLCVSHDWSLARHVAKDSPIGSPEKRKKLNPHDYLYIKNVVFPMLGEMGLSEDVIETILIDAPRNFFEGV